MIKVRKKKMKIGFGYLISRLIIISLLICTFYPMFTLINMSFKPNIIIQTNFLGLADFSYFNNYIKAVKDIIQPVMNSLFVSVTTILITTVIVVLAGYAFGRLKFFGKEFFFYLLLIVMMIPNVLLIIPTYQIIFRAGWSGSFLGLIIPYISGMQIYGIIMTRAFFGDLPEELFEAGRIDGASENFLLIRIAVPLSKPILITTAIVSLIAMYNDYIWPAIVLSGEPKKATFCQIAFNTAGGNGSTDLGYLAAFFVLGTIPLLIITSFSMKYYMQGITEGAVKG